MARASAPTNPFQYGALALDQAFTDREREIAELSADVRNGQDVVIFAPRRYGKSSLIWRVVQRLVKRGVLVGQIDLGLPKLMRSAFQEQPEVAHVYLGSKRHMMERIFNDANEPFWRSAKQMELGVIDPAAFEPWVLERFEQTGKRVSADALARAFEITRGHPYATQELFYFLWGQTSAGATAGLDQLELALEGTLRSENAHFGLLWDSLAAAQRLVLLAL